MMKGKIMSAGNLDDIMGRMIHCRAALDAIRASDDNNPLADALAGASDLLRSICQDFDADISAAEDYISKEDAKC